MNRNVKTSVAAVAVVGAVAAGLHYGQGRNVRDTITVNLVPTNGCTPQVTEVIGAAYTRLVRWNIVNGCPGAQVVTIPDVFTDNGSGGKTTTPERVFNPQPVNSGNIPPSANPRPMTATIAKLVLVQSVYHYTICTSDPNGGNRRCLDPDVEIWP